MNQWLERIDIWNGASFGQGDSNLFNEIPTVGSCMAPTLGG